MKKIVIWGDDHHNALGLLRMLGGHGFDILFLVNSPLYNIATASKYCTKFVVVNSVQEGLDYLFKSYTDSKDKAVLLLTYDKYSEAANEHLNKLNEFFYVAGPTIPGSLKDYDYKYTMGKIAEECGIKIPQTYLYPKYNIEKIKHFPVVIKSNDPTSKDIKIKLAENQEELLKISKTFFPDKEYVIQQYIEKEADGLIYGCRSWKKQTIIAGICIRNRWSDDGCGSFGYITPDIPTSINIKGIETFLEKIDFKGLFSVEYAITKDDAFFYEFNLRNDGTSVLFYNAGSNIALAYVNSCFGIKEDVSTTVKGKQYLMNEFWDEFNVRDGVISKEQWLDDKNKATLFFYYDPNDMKPYEVQKSLNLKRKLRRFISKSWINKKRLEFKNYLIRRKYANNIKR